MLTMVDVTAWLRLGYVLSSLPHVHHLFFWQRSITAVIRTALAKSESWVIYKRTKTRNLRLGLLPYYNNLHAEHLTSYTNILQLIDYQHFTQCKMLPILPTRNLHNPHAATRHKHGRVISRHRGAEKSVAPTDCSTSLWRKIYRIHPNRLLGSGVGCVRCMQGSVRYFEIILHSWNFCISTCYAQKV